MSHIYAVDNLASSYAIMVTQSLNPEVPQGAKDKYIKLLKVDYKISNFNAASVTMITALALGIIANSVLLLAVGAVAAYIRSVYLSHIIKVLPQGVDLANLNADIEAIKIHFSQTGENWQPVEVQFLDFIVWMNRLHVSAPIPPSPSFDGFEPVDVNN